MKVYGLHVTRVCAALTICFASFLFGAEGPQGYSYAGEIDGRPCQVFLNWYGDEVVGFLTKPGETPLTMRLAGENYTQGSLTLQGSQGYDGNRAILKLKRSSEGSVTKWSGTIFFRDGHSFPIFFERKQKGAARTDVFVPSMGGPERATEASSPT